MRLIDADALLEFERFDRELIGEEHTAEDILMMIQTAPTITPESLAGQEQQSGCCKFCNTVYDDWSYDGVHVLRLNGNILFYFDHTFGWEGIGIKFCPMCGRELDSEE